METGKEFSALLQVLAGEQQIIQRTDQKANREFKELRGQWALPVQSSLQIN